MRYCDGCGGTAGERRKYSDPRRDSDEAEAYVELYFCSPSCEEAIIDELERKARIARLVN